MDRMHDSALSGLDDGGVLKIDVPEQAACFECLHIQPPPILMK
jgi:hypothetical protein